VLLAGDLRERAQPSTKTRPGRRPRSTIWWRTPASGSPSGHRKTCPRCSAARPSGRSGAAQQPGM